MDRLFTSFVRHIDVSLILLRSYGRTILCKWQLSFLNTRDLQYVLQAEYMYSKADTTRYYTEAYNFLKCRSDKILQLGKITRLMR